MKLIDSIPQQAISRKDQIILNIYIKFVYDVNKIIENCIGSRNYSALIQDVNIEEFLKIKYESFD